VQLLRKEIRQREDAIVSSIISSASIVLTTTVGASSRLLRGAEFDLCVIDEAAQALEAACWIPALKARRLVLAGDHLQLPPTVKSDKAASLGLSTTMFDRAMSLYGSSCSRMLTTQYRMHRLISGWSSAALYGSKLVPAPSVEARLVSGLPTATPEAAGVPTLALVDTAGCDLEEATNAAGSRLNEGEVRTPLF
jgi:superfamily I DNA and/or RNA helicase